MTLCVRFIQFALYEAYGTRPYEWGEDPDRQKANTKEEETDLGLLNEGMRFRDLETGTFLTRDPIGFKDGPNQYCYVQCNPITRFDAIGLSTKRPYQGASPNYTHTEYLDSGDPGWNREDIPDGGRQVQFGQPTVFSRDFSKKNGGEWQWRYPQGRERDYFNWNPDGTVSDQLPPIDSVGMHLNNSELIEFSGKVGSFYEPLEKCVNVSLELAGFALPVPTPGKTALARAIFHATKGAVENALSQSAEKGRVDKEELFISTLASLGGGVAGDTVKELFENMPDGMKKKIIETVTEKIAETPFKAVETLYEELQKMEEVDIPDPDIPDPVIPDQNSSSSND